MFIRLPNGEYLNPNSIISLHPDFKIDLNYGYYNYISNNEEEKKAVRATYSLKIITASKLMVETPLTGFEQAMMNTGANSLKSETLIKYSFETKYIYKKQFSARDKVYFGDPIWTLERCANNNLFTVQETLKDLIDAGILPHYTIPELKL